MTIFKNPRRDCHRRSNGRRDGEIRPFNVSQEATLNVSGVLQTGGEVGTICVEERFSEEYFLNRRVPKSLS